jgi:NAD(P)-dependent dehydrogenase (short-subunit alcohol dehydrogenase family)
MDLSRYSMEGRTVIITGGSGGIGRGCARAFAQAGANVVVASLPADSIPPVLAEIEELGGQALGVTANVTVAEQVDDIVKQTLDRFGRIDVLLNIAGGTYSRNPEMPQFIRAPLLELGEGDFMTAYEANVKSTFLCARAVVPHMKAVGKGAIVNTSSTLYLGPHGKSTGEMSAYGAAKAAVASLTVHMASQWGPEVRVNCIAPGVIDTFRAPGGGTRPGVSAAANRVSVGRVGEADDIGGVALFLASDAASFINGIVMPVDGG